MIVEEEQSLTTQKWEVKANRFVVFLDILGFKDMVLNSTHDAIFKKLEILKSYSTRIDSFGPYVELGIEVNQTKTVAFSDSIIIFSKSDSRGDFWKIVSQIRAVQKRAFENAIPIKGAISYGEISVDFENSIFFGQPIIDAFSLHGDLKQLSIILDHKSENRIDALFNLDSQQDLFVNYKAFLDYGKVEHRLLFPDKEDRESILNDLIKMYKNTSGRHRIYLDNTKDFMEYVINFYKK